MTNENGNSAVKKLEAVSYFVDAKTAESEYRSIEGVLAARLCTACTGENGEKSSSAAPGYIKQIFRCCSKKEGFIDPAMPLQEIVFRVILKGGNKPMKLSAIHHVLAEEWALPTHPMNMGVGALKQILDRDEFYGISALDN